MSDELNFSFDFIFYAYSPSCNCSKLSCKLKQLRKSDWACSRSSPPEGSSGAVRSQSAVQSQRGKYGSWTPCHRTSLLEVYLVDSKTDWQRPQSLTASNRKQSRAWNHAYFTEWYTLRRHLCCPIMALFTDHCEQEVRALRDFLARSADAYSPAPENSDKYPWQLINQFKTRPGLWIYQKRRFRAGAGICCCRSLSHGTAWGGRGRSAAGNYSECFRDSRVAGAKLQGSRRVHQGCHSDRPDYCRAQMPFNDLNTLGSAIPHTHCTPAPNTDSNHNHNRHSQSRCYYFERHSLGNYSHFSYNRSYYCDHFVNSTGFNCFDQSTSIKFKFKNKY